MKLEEGNAVVNFDGWSNYCSTFPVLSKRLAPFRRHTVKYTGMQTTKRNWALSESEMVKFEKKVSKLLEKGLYCKNAYETTQFYRGEFFIFMENLIEWDFSEMLCVLDRVIQFFTNAMKLIIKLLDTYPSLFQYYFKSLENSDLFLTDNDVALAKTWPEIMDTLNKMLAMDPRCRRFFLTYHNYPEDYVFSPYSLKKDTYSGTFLYLLNLFASLEGFEKIVQIVSNSNPESKVPINFLNSFTLYSLKDFIDPGYFNSFVEALTLSIINRLSLIDDKDLKFIDIDIITSLLNSSKNCETNITEKSLEKSNVIIYCKMVKSNYMEKRIKGINELATYIEFIDKMKLEETEIFEILKSEDILTDILETRIHLEILKRSARILKLFAKANSITLHECEILWAFSQDNQKLISDAGYFIIIEISPWLDLKLINYFYNNLASFSDNLLNLQSITEFSIKVLENKEFDNIFGVDLLYNLILDSSDSGRWKESTEHLIKIYSVEKASSLRNKFLNELPHKLASLDSIPQYLNIALGIFKQLNKEEVIHICKEKNIEDNIVSNTLKYLTTMKETQESITRDTYYSKFKHYEHILCRLEILEYIFTATEFTIHLKKSKFRSLWKSFIKSPVCKDDSSIFFRSINSGVRYGPLINNVSEIFQKFFLDDKYFSTSSVEVSSFKAFKSLFFKANSPHNIEIEGNRFKFVKSAELIGLDKIIHILIEAESPILEKTSKLLKKLLSYYSPEFSLENISKSFDKFLNLLMDALLTGDSDMYNRALNFFMSMMDLETSETQKATFFIFTGVKYFDLSLPLYGTIRSIRKAIAEKLEIPLNEVSFKIGDIVYSHVVDYKIIKLSKEKPLYLNTLPYTVFEYKDAAKIIANHHRVFKFIFSKAIPEPSCKEKAWYLVSKFPENLKFVKFFEEINENVEKIFPEDDFEFLFSLYTVKKCCESSEWLEKFLSYGGQQALNKRYYSLKIADKTELIPKQEEILLSILQIVSINDNYKTKCFEALLSTISDISPKSDQLENPNSVIAYIEEILKFYYNNFDHEIIEICKRSITKLLKHLMDMVIYSGGDKIYLGRIIDILIRLIRESNTNIIALNILISYKSIVLQSNRPSHYWHFVSKIIDLQNIEGTLGQIAQDIYTNDLFLFQELSASEMNASLCGLLSILRSCTNHINFYVPSIHQLAQDLLIGAPEENKPNVPFCKSLRSRKVGYEFILSLLSYNPQELSEFLKYVDKTFHKTTIWRNSKYRNWNLSINIIEKSRLGFVGLENPGCICYMNSLFQQLYLIRTFSNTLLQISSDSIDSILYQLKSIFSQLKYSDSPYISPRRFCKNFKDFDGKPVNIFEQMDADEFFGRLMERMEEDLKTAGENLLIKNHFGGTQAVEMISQQCEHRNERLELMMSVPLDIKNKTCLQESLKTLINGEILQGDNAYFCEGCSKKVQALMRISLKHLPNFLVFALRRFEFNFDTMTRNKIDDYFEFPFDINMKEYTTEYLNEAALSCEGYYEYKLKGVVIHHGKAEQGHYFSYIFNEGVWYEFNDTSVSIISEDIVKSNGYGQNQNNKIMPTAYLLIYEREMKFKYNQLDSMMDIVLDQNQELINMDSIKEKNNNYWIKKFALSYDYLHFHSKIISKQNFGHCDVTLKFFLTILLRVERAYKEKLQFFKYLESNMDSEFCIILLDTMTSENGIKEFLIFCPNPLSRKLVVMLVKSIFQRFDEEYKLKFFTQYLRYSKFALKSVSIYYSQYLELLVYFAETLPEYTKQNNLVNSLMRIALGFIDDFPCSDYPDENHLGYPERYKVTNTRIHDAFGTSVAFVIEFLAKFSENLSEEFFEYATSQAGYESFLGVLDNKRSNRAYAKLYVNLFSNNLESSIHFAMYLLSKYLEPSQDQKSRMILIFSQFIKQHPQRLEIVKNVIDFYTEYIPQYNSADTQQLIGYLFKLIKNIDYSDISDNFSEQKVEKIALWLQQNSYSKFNEEIIENPVIINYYNKICKVKEDTNYDQEDSDDEFSEKFFTPRNNLYVYDTGRKMWVKGQIEDTIEKEVVLVYCTINGNGNHLLKDTNYDELYRAS